MLLLAALAVAYNVVSFYHGNSFLHQVLTRQDQTSSLKNSSSRCVKEIFLSLDEKKMKIHGVSNGRYVFIVARKQGFSSSAEGGLSDTSRSDAEKVRCSQSLLVSCRKMAERGCVCSQMIRGQRCSSE